MTREIKFRAWDNKGKYWYPAETIKDFFNYLSEKFAIVADWFNKDAIILEQYTGLKDENGKEIYEGDIVKVAGAGVSQVIQSGWGEWQLCDLINSNGNILSLGYCLGREYCEVIGNIHENPELL